MLAEHPSQPVGEAVSIAYEEPAVPTWGHYFKIGDVLAHSGLRSIRHCPVTVLHVTRSARQPVPLGRPGDDEAGVGAVDADAPQPILVRASLVPRDEDAVAPR